MARREYLVRMDGTLPSRLVRHIFSLMVFLAVSPLIVGDLVYEGFLDGSPILVVLGLGLLGLLGVFMANTRYAATAVMSESGITVLGFLGSKNHLPWTEIERFERGAIGTYQGTGGSIKTAKGFRIYQRGQQEPWTFGFSNAGMKVLHEAAVLAANGQPDASAELIRTKGTRRGPVRIPYLRSQALVGVISLALLVMVARDDRSLRAQQEMSYSSDERATMERLEEILNDRWIRSRVRCQAATSIVLMHTYNLSFDAAAEMCRVHEKMGCSAYDRCEHVPHRAAVQEALEAGDGAAALRILEEHLPQDRPHYPFWFEALNDVGERDEIIALARHCVATLDRSPAEPPEPCVEELWRRFGLEAEPLEDAHPDSAPAHVIEHGPLVVAFPDDFPKPSRESHTESSSGLDVEVTMFSTYSEERDAKVIVAHSEYPDDLPGPPSSEDLIEASAQNMLSALSGELLREEATTIHGRPARQFLALKERGDEKIYVRLQLRAAAPHVVSIMYLSPVRSELSSPPANQLFDSLRLP